MRSRVVRGRDFEVVLHPGSYVIGRDSDCRLKLSSPQASRRHAVLVVSPQSLIIEDLGSSLGVMVNGRRIVGGFTLSMGDVVTLGDETLTFVERVATVAQPVERSSPEQLGSTPGPDDHDATQVERPSSANDELISQFTRTIDDALQAGRTADAEKLVSTRWSVLATLRGAGSDDADKLAETARAALRLAIAKRDSAWVGRVVLAFTDRRLLMPVPVVEALGLCVAAFPNDHHESLRRYRDVIEAERLRENPKNAFAILRFYSICRRVFMPR